ncbi:unnamed protein product [Arctogadus glacialis]
MSLLYPLSKSSTPPCCHHWSKKSITVRISWARSRGGGQLMASSAGGPAGEGHPLWGRDIRLRDVKAAEDPPGSPWRTTMGLLEVFGSTSVQNAFQRMKPTHPWLS